MSKKCADCGKPQQTTKGHRCGSCANTLRWSDGSRRRAICYSHCLECSGEKCPTIYPLCHSCSTKQTYDRIPDLRKQRAEQFSKIAKNRTGPKNSRWRGGKSFEPYSHTFNKDLKQMVRERDGEKCRLCSETENLQVHHVDYDKMNDDAENLVTLCAHHHGKTNSARQFWQVVFTRYMGRAPSRYPAVRGIV